MPEHTPPADRPEDEDDLFLQFFRAIRRLAGDGASALLFVLLLSLPLQDARRLIVKAQMEASPPVVPDSRVDINTADFTVLQSLPGIGPVLARQIIKRRPYKTPRKLGNVPGIGPKRLERLLPHIKFDSEP